MSRTGSAPESEPPSRPSEHGAAASEDPSPGDPWRPWVDLALVAFSIAIGIFADLGHKLPGDLGFVPQLGAPWIVMSFLAGANRRHQGWAAVAGVAPIMIGLVSYHLFKLTAYGPNSVGVFGSTWWAWALVACVLGFFGGLAGHLVRVGRTRPYGWGILAGLFLGEAAALLYGRFAGPRPVAYSEALVGVLLIFIGARRAAIGRILAAAGLTFAVSFAGVAAATFVLRLPFPFR